MDVSSVEIKSSEDSRCLEIANMAKINEATQILVILFPNLT